MNYDRRCVILQSYLDFYNIIIIILWFTEMACLFYFIDNYKLIPVYPYNSNKVFIKLYPIMTETFLKTF